MADYLSRPGTAPPDDLELEEREEEECIYEVTNLGDSSMKVVVRVRPESEAELRSSSQCVVKVLDEHVLVFDPAGNRSDTESKKPFGAFSSPSEDTLMVNLAKLSTFCLASKDSKNVYD